MMRPRGIPADLDAKTSAQIERSFLVLRAVRGSLLLAFVVIAALAVELKGWPHGVTFALALAGMLLAARLGSDVRRLTGR